MEKQSDFMKCQGGGNKLKCRLKNRLILIAVLLFASAVLCAACGRKEEKQKSPAPDTGAAVSGETRTEQPVTGTSISGTSVADKPSMEARSRNYAEQIVSGIMTELWVNLTEELASQMTVDGLQASWNSVAEGAGTYEGIEDVQSEDNNEYHIVLVTLRYRRNQGRSIRFVYDRDENIAGIWFDVAEVSKKGEDTGPETLGAWSEEDISVGRNPFALKGKLTLPQGGKAPVVILLADHEDADMDGTMGKNANKPLRDLAHGLAERGIASLRYNRRGHQYSGSVTAEDSMYETLFQDVWYAVDQMYNERRVDRKRIFILGMGRAADFMPGIVKKKPRRLAGAVMMAAKPMAAAEKFYSREEKNITSDAAYFMDENSTFPLLMLQGEEDFQTRVNDFEQWKEIWKGRSHVKYHSYRGLNHYFMTASGKEDKGEYDKEGRVSQTVIRDIAEWCSATAEGK